MLQAGADRRQQAVHGFLARALAHNADAQHLARKSAKAASHLYFVLCAQAGAQSVGVHPVGRHEKIDLGAAPWVT